jgi:dGTPase
VEQTDGVGKSGKQVNGSTALGCAQPGRSWSICPLTMPVPTVATRDRRYDAGMYNDFDKSCFPEPRKKKDYRTPFAIDRDRIIHSRAFRRLQAKTQVFSTGEYDFYRTRLTHSVEVGQIGRSICKFLAHSFVGMPEVDLDLVEAACLSHDLGNPPFGHSGERTLHGCMQNYGGFEGNAQTMRLLTKRIFTEQHVRTGIKPTRALMDAVCKYKGFWNPGMQNHFLYEDQHECTEFIHAGLQVTEQSIECQIMDWSDDIANGYADINDGVKARLIDVAALERWASSQTLNPQDSADVTKVIESIKKDDTEKFRALGIGECIQGTSVVERNGPLASQTQRHCYGIAVKPEIQKRCKLMKNIAKGIVIQSALVQQLEMKTQRMMKDLFTLLLDNYIGNNPKSLLPHEAHLEVTSASDERGKARFICDHLSGMSDDFAVRTYRRLYDPLFGSIGDFI